MSDDRSSKHRLSLWARGNSALADACRSTIAETERLQSRLSDAEKIIGHIAKDSAQAGSVCRAYISGYEQPSHEPSATQAEREDMENIGSAFMDELRNNLPEYSWAQCPSEVIVDLINQRDDARASQPPSDAPYIAAIRTALAYLQGPAPMMHSAIERLQEALPECASETKEAPHDEHCDVNDPIIKGKPCNCRDRVPVETSVTPGEKR